MAEQGMEVPESIDYSIGEEDLTINAQYAMLIFNYLPDNVDGMAGGWIGKSFDSLEYIMNLFNVPNQRRVFELIWVCIGEYKNLLEDRRKIEDSRPKIK